MKVKITVDGKVLETALFVNDIVGNVVRGLITPLRGVESPRKAVIEVDFEEN
ncbi:MAG: hypothetical protein HYU39_04950 [Thaumarchaeota archaeon]|nr:hypothetical protein [Nitrososphaerota archaeon]